MSVIEQSSQFGLYVLVTGIHMMKCCGSTYLEVKIENCTNNYFTSNQNENEPMSSVLGNAITILLLTLLTLFLQI